jgi:hypothetical protein
MCIARRQVSSETSLGKTLGEWSSSLPSSLPSGNQGWAANRGQVVPPAALLLSLDAQPSKSQNYKPGKGCLKSALSGGRSSVHFLQNLAPEDKDLLLEILFISVTM